MSTQVQKTMNATITTGQYTDNQGNQKKSYLTIGTLFIYANGGMSLKLDALPLAGQNINFYDIKPKNNNNNNGGNGQSYNQNNNNNNYGGNGGY